MIEKVCKILLNSSLLYVMVLMIMPCLPSGRLLSDTISKDEGLNIYIIDPIGEQPVLNNSLPKSAIKNNIVSIRVAKGEIEPFSFVMESVVDDIEDVSLVHSELVGEKGVFGADDIDIRVVKIWYQNPGEASSLSATLKRGAIHLVPELLLKDESLVLVDHENKKNFLRLDFPSGSKYVSISEKFPKSNSRIISEIKDFPVKDSKYLQPITLKKGEYKQIWVTINVPKDMNDGMYKGDIKIQSGEVVLGKVYINLEVLPFQLPRPNKMYSIYYRGKLAKFGSISSERKSMMQYHAEQKNMAEHGIEIPTLYQSAKREELSIVLGIRDRYWPDKKPLYYLGMGTGNPRDEEGLKALENDVYRLLNIIKCYNIDDLFIYGIDEATGELLSSQIDAWDRVRKSGAKIFTAGYAGTYRLVGSYLDLLNLGGYPKKNEINLFRLNGKKIFMYGYPQTANENPYIYRKNYGIELWRNGYDGAMPYAYQDSFGFIWNDFDHQSYRDHVFAYPTVDGVIDTVAWEGFREAVDDVRYITLLERYVNNKPLYKEETQESLLQAKQLLNQLKEQGAKDLNSMRRAIVDSILKLNSDGIHLTVGQN